MPNSPGYTSHLSAEAVAFVVSLTKRKQTKVLDFAERIAEQPVQIGDFTSVDAVGHSIENLLMDEFLFSFWVDHAVKEVRIVEIIAV